MEKLTIVIAGATGFVGSALARRLATQHRVICLSRTEKNPSPESQISEWRKCDLFSLIDAEAALKGADVAYYLVHSMMPSARLTQGSFDNLDLIAADNFARAAATNGTKQIIYLGGLIPKGVPLSRHLNSRLEVENTLGAYSSPLTALRAGLIIGAEGSSFQMLYRLVKRLPIMLCPQWTKTPTQPIFLDDVVKLLAYCLNRKENFGQSYDIGGPDLVTYRGMLSLLAGMMGLRRRTFGVNLFSPGLSRLWVSLITGAPRSLVSPLVQSLKHEMVAGDRRLQLEAGIDGDSLPTAFAKTLARAETPQSKSPVAFRSRENKDVRSVQRFILPEGRDAQWVSSEYVRWLPKIFLPVRVKIQENKTVFFHLPPLTKPLLILSYAPERSYPSRALFYIRGGLLAKIQGRGRFEFRESWDRRFVLAAVHDFRPRLPWFIYSITQAHIHSLVMWSFGRHLKRLAKRGKDRA